MANRKNKHGLNRHIPNKISLEIRQRCGFGCVVCGNAIYDYEHFNPEFHNAKKHDPLGITLLCPTCHGNKTRGFWSSTKIAADDKNPYCKRVGVSTLHMDVSASPFTIEILNQKIINTNVVLRILDTDLLRIDPPSIPGMPPEISGIFYDQHGNRIASIHKNVWNGNASNFDIISSGSTLEIRSKISALELVIEIDHPNILRILKMNLSYKQHEILVDNNEFRFQRPSSYLKIDKDVENVIENQAYAFIATSKGFSYSSGSALAPMAFGEISVGPYDVTGDETSVEILMPDASQVGFPMDKPYTKLLFKVRGEARELCLGPMTMVSSDDPNVPE